MSDKNIEGYWFEKPFSNYSKISEFPMPVANVLNDNEAKVIYDLIIDKEKTAKITAYRGFSCSRITGENLGNKEFETEEWIWPGDFAKHYVLEHKVKPTDEFLRYINYKK
jgi:hypothetical protein